MWWIIIFVLGCLVIICSYFRKQVRIEKQNEVIKEVEQMLNEVFPDSEDMQDKLERISNDRLFLDRLDEIIKKMNNFKLGFILRNPSLIVFVSIFCYTLLKRADEIHFGGKGDV